MELSPEMSRYWARMVTSQAASAMPAEWVAEFRQAIQRGAASGVVELSSDQIEVVRAAEMETGMYPPSR